MMTENSRRWSSASASARVGEGDDVVVLAFKNPPSTSQMPGSSSTRRML